MIPCPTRGPEAAPIKHRVRLDGGVSIEPASSASAPSIVTNRGSARAKLRPCARWRRSSCAAAERRGLGYCLRPRSTSRVRAVSRSAICSAASGAAPSSSQPGGFRRRWLDVGRWPTMSYRRSYTSRPVVDVLVDQDDPGRVLVRVKGDDGAPRPGDAGRRACPGARRSRGSARPRSACRPARRGSARRRASSGRAGAAICASAMRVARTPTGTYAAEVRRGASTFPSPRRVCARLSCRSPRSSSAASDSRR